MVLFHACLFDTGLFIFLFAKGPTATRGAATPFAYVWPPCEAFSACVFAYIACLARLFGLVCTSACKTAWRASRGTDPRPGEGERVLSGLLPRARVPQTVTNRISRSAASRCAAHGRPAGSWPQKKKKTSSCATRITHAGSSPQPTPPSLLLPLTWQSLPRIRTATPTSLKTSFTAGGLNTARAALGQGEFAVLCL